jgi:NitT/TauT family transport system substrate-binding protein
MQIMQSRRLFVASATLTGAAGLIGASKPLRAESSPETATVRFAKNPSFCVAPQYVAEQLLRAEGFTDIAYLPSRSGADTAASIAHGEVDFGTVFAGTVVSRIDARDPITLLAGVHVGCYELFANERLHSIADLKGKRVGVQALGSSGHLLLSSMATYVGLDPVNDIDWVKSPEVEPIELFVDGKIDAFIGFPPEPQELRSRGINHVVVNTALDRPWSQYFCCMFIGNRNFIQDHPAATKRVLRSILKATDQCASDPEMAAQMLVDRGFSARYDHALQTMKEVPYGLWRDYDPEDTVRFYALRLHEAGMIKSSPQKIIADGTDWRFIDELKRELKT